MCIYVDVPWLCSTFELFLHLAHDPILYVPIQMSFATSIYCQVFGNEWIYCLAQASYSGLNLPISFCPLESTVPCLIQLWGAIPDFSVILRTWSAFYIRQDDFFNYLLAQTIIRTALKFGHEGVRKKKYCTNLNTLKVVWFIQNWFLSTFFIKNSLKLIYRYESVWIRLMIYLIKSVNWIQNIYSSMLVIVFVKKATFKSSRCYIYHQLCCN